MNEAALKREAEIEDRAQLSSGQSARRAILDARGYVFGCGLVLAGEYCFPPSFFRNPEHGPIVLNARVAEAPGLCGICVDYRAGYIGTSVNCYARTRNHRSSGDTDTQGLRVDAGIPAALATGLRVRLYVCYPPNLVTS